MSKRWILALGALALCLSTAVIAFAQTIGNWGQKNQPTQSATSPSVPAVRVHVTGGVNPSDTSFVPFQFSSGGYLLFSDASRDRDNWRLYPNIINNQLCVSVAGGNVLVDSSQVQDTHDMRSLALVLYGQHDSLSSVVRLAVQIRAHYNTQVDSGSTYPWYRWPVRSTTAATDALDSLGHFTSGIYTLAAATSANTSNTSEGLWSGEFLVKFDVVRNDSTAAGNGKFGAYPKGMWIPLVDHDGVPFRAPYTSVRIRVVNGIKSRFKIRADLVGTTL